MVWRMRKLGWITVTHVCQHWCQVALGDSSLWAGIMGYLPNVKWTFKMLFCIQNVPLVIDSATTPVFGTLLHRTWPM